MVSLLAPFFFSLSFSTLTQCGEPYKDIEKMVRKAASGQTEKKHKLQSVDLYKMKWRVVNRAEVIGDVSQDS